MKRKNFFGDKEYEGKKSVQVDRTEFVAYTENKWFATLLSDNSRNISYVARE